MLSIAFSSSDAEALSQAFIMIVVSEIGELFALGGVGRPVD
jgi:hypothetical protein